MIDAHTYGVFLVTALVLVVSPGPDTLHVLSRTVASGTLAGLMALLGTQAGNIVHAVLAGIGVSTVILLFPFAFNVLKIVGVIYLVYLAVATWRAPATLTLNADPDGTRGFGRYFIQGFANNLANPKMIAFFLALFPQFVRPDQGSLAVQSLVLGSTLALMATIWIGLVVMGIGRFRAAMVRRPGFLKFANRLAAMTFVGLACRLAIEDGR